MFKHVALLFVIVGCSRSYYVADVRYEGDELVAERCAFGHRNGPSTDCYLEPIVPPTADPAELAAAKRDLVAATHEVAVSASRPAPTTDDVSHALASPSVHRAVELCRMRYDKHVTHFEFTLEVAPSGDISIASHDASPFADCASHALRTANLHSYEGAAVSFEQQLVL